VCRTSPNGEFPALSIKALNEIGEWMDEFGDMIYGTRSTLVLPQKWGVTTHKGKRMFLHIMNPEGTAITVPYVGNRLIVAKRFGTDEKIEFKRGKDGFTLMFASLPEDEIDYIVELTFANDI